MERALPVNAEQGPGADVTAEFLFYTVRKEIPRPIAAAGSADVRFEN